jgi:hypothetical protein
MRLLTTLTLEDTAAFTAWCKEQNLEHTTGSTYVNGRVEKWFVNGSNLQSIASGRGRIFPAESLPASIAAVGNRFLRGWNSVLVCGGKTTISWHRDHGHFHGPAVMINLGEALYEEAARNADMKNLTGVTGLKLLNGNVVWIDTKNPHRATQLSAERFNITFRTIKPEFLVPGAM